MISLKQIPENKKEIERLATFQALDQENQKRKKRGPASAQQKMQDL